VATEKNPLLTCKQKCALKQKELSTIIKISPEFSLSRGFYCQASKDNQRHDTPNLFSKRKTGCKYYWKFLPGYLQAQYFQFQRAVYALFL